MPDPARSVHPTLLVWLVILALFSPGSIAQQDSGVAGDPLRFEHAALPALPIDLTAGVSARHTAIVAGPLDGRLLLVDSTGAGDSVRIDRLEGDAWAASGAVAVETPIVDAVAGDAGLLLIGSDGSVTALRPDGDGYRTEPLAGPVAHPTGKAAILEGVLFVPTETGISTLDTRAAAAGWTPMPMQPTDEPLHDAVLAASFGQLLIFARTRDGEPFAATWSSTDGWRDVDPPSRPAANWPGQTAAVPVGPSHVFLVTAAAEAGGMPRLDVFHTITVRWIEDVPIGPEAAGAIAAVPFKGSIALLGPKSGTLATVEPITAHFPWIDYAVVAAYLLGMVVMGWFFMRREASSDDYFRGGRSIPWWASGMSLFATGASAISLMAMPAKSYSTDWGYFTVSILTVLVLPISLFLLAPIIRRLNISTANEYLDRRFGLTARLFASLIYIFTQIAGRMAPVMLLPAIALSAITGIDVWVSIVVMGGITTAYTFLGGLKAVIWTDTVQGFIMIIAIGSCLVLVMIRLGMGPVDMAIQANELGKLRTFDFSPSLYHATLLAWIIQTIVVTFGYLADQNYVQRVEAVPTLKDAQRAIAMQIAIAIPINILVFSLGTALWFFYRGHPGDLNPVMETDGIYPFFVAQQLPVGASGLVVAALLAATMSTISSSICAVSDLGVNDFYKRFFRGASERSSLIVARTLMASVGVAGTALAILLSTLGETSIWDLALKVTGLISNSIIGLFWLGLLTKRANEIGAITGVIAGIVCVWFCQANTMISFLIYQAIGSAVAIVVGYGVSLLVPIGRRDTTGLTLATMQLSKADLHDQHTSGAEQ